MTQLLTMTPTHKLPLQVFKVYDEKANGNDKTTLVLDTPLDDQPKPNSKVDPSEQKENQKANTKAEDTNADQLKEGIELEDIPATGAKGEKPLNSEESKMDGKKGDFVRRWKVKTSDKKPEQRDSAKEEEYDSESVSL